MKDEWVKMKNKETDDILLMNKGAKSRFLEGEEFVMVKWLDNQRTFYMKRSALMNWK